MATMKDIIQSPLLPALFGSMALGLFASSASGSKVVKGGIKGVLPVLVIMTVLSLAARLAGYGSVLGGLVGIFIIVMLPIGILISYVLWKKGKIQVVDKGKQKNSRTDVREFFVAYSAFSSFLSISNSGISSVLTMVSISSSFAQSSGEKRSLARSTTVCR